MTRHRFILTAIALLLSACAPRAVPPGATTTVIALRHADRFGNDLSDKGRERAAALPAALAGYDIDAIYAPDIKRNLDTAAPLARATGLRVRTIAVETAAGRMTSAHPGGTVVWVGNKANLKTLWQDLNAPGDPPLDYGDLFVVTLQGDGKRSLRRLHFGD